MSFTTLTGLRFCIKQNLLFCFETTTMCKTQCGLSTLPANTRRWPNAGPMLAHRLQCRPSSKPTLVQHFVFDGLWVWQCIPKVTWEIVGLKLSQHCRRWTNIEPTLAQYIELAGHAGVEYKPTPTQCLLNVGPAWPMLASIHSVLHSGRILCTWIAYTAPNVGQSRTQWIYQHVA